MLANGLNYQNSRSSTVEEFTEDLSSFKIDDSTALSGGPILFRNNDKVFFDSSDSHNLIIGDTGSMKTLRFVLPLIYSCSLAGESMINLDPKGELARKTTGFLKEKGYKVVTINLRQPHLSKDKWNPLAIIAELYGQNQRNQQLALLQLNDICNDLFYNRSSASKDIYWNESAGQLALGILQLMLLLSDKKSFNMESLLKWRYEKIPDGTLKSYFEQVPKDSEIYQNLAGYMALTAENTKSCILSTFDQLIRIFKASPALTKLLSKSTFDMRKFGREKTAVFLIVPDEKTTFHFLATLFIKQCYQTLLEEADKNNGELPLRVNFILEEFCNLPVLPDIIPMLTAARSRNIRMHLVIQSFNQMAGKYGDHDSHAILDNCGNLIYLHSRELSFLNYISELAGYTEYGNPLLSVSRLQRLKKNETLIFHNRCYPLIVQDIPLIFEYPVSIRNKYLGESGQECLYFQEEDSSSKSNCEWCLPNL